MRECEELLKCVQRSRDSWLDLTSGSRLQAARLMHTCQACQKLKRHQLFTIGQKSQAGQAICSRLELVTQPSREVKLPEHLVWQNMTFHIPSHPTLSLSLSIYIYPYTHDSKRASRENFERETLEKTRLTHPQSLPKRLFKFLYSLPLHCQTLERLFTKTFSHHIHFYERAI